MHAYIQCMDGCIYTYLGIGLMMVVCLLVYHHNDHDLRHEQTNNQSAETHAHIIILWTYPLRLAYNT